MICSTLTNNLWRFCCLHLNQLLRAGSAVPALSVNSRNLPIKLGKISFKIHWFYKIKSQQIWKCTLQMIIDFKNKKENDYSLLVIFTLKSFEIEISNKGFVTAVSKEHTRKSQLSVILSFSAKFLSSACSKI